MDMKDLDIVVISGAGLSAESGIPTYRGENGIYTKIQEELKQPIESIIHPHTIKNDPELFWRYWWNIKKQVSDCKPNKSHYLLKEISERSRSFLEITQNVDGFSKACGINDEKIIELHGAANEYFCIRCGQKADINSFNQSGVPKCIHCKEHKKSVIRPRVVMFSENIKSDHYKKAMYKASRCSLLIIVGTELHFPYLIDILMEARKNDATIVNINPTPFEDITYYDQFYGVSSRYGVENIQKTASAGLADLIDDISKKEIRHKLL